MIIAPAASDDAIGIYIHIPFCAHICPYCDFTTYAGKADLIPRYVRALEVDLRRQGERYADRAVATIFIGGGTPSLLSSDQMRAILDACAGSFQIEPDAEISVECNPNGLTAELLAGYRQAGVNRLSIGAQTLDRRGLRTLGRQHESSDTLAALNAARDAGFDNVSLDLIFGWPGQTLDSWKQDLSTVLHYPTSPEHLSLYGLIVEPGTPFADAAARGILSVPDDDASADLYETAVSTMASAGWTHYEVANWARSSDLVSRHNAVYWRNGDYIGIGAGAHGHAANLRTMNHLLPETYCEAVERGDATASNSETIEERTALGETMMLGLRLVQDGVDADAFGRRHEQTLDKAFGATIEELIELGMLQRNERSVWL
ncbi:MAG: radical SAM family heme chaperone HemW, partial [Chloroflexia bacterium]|nr:radical SAM family heme chaperone HemW [Chloroflexia bacterium]